MVFSLKYKITGSIFAVQPMRTIDNIIGKHLSIVEKPGSKLQVVKKEPSIFNELIYLDFLILQIKKLYILYAVKEFHKNCDKGKVIYFLIK